MKIATNVIFYHFKNCAFAKMIAKNNDTFSEILHFSEFFPLTYIYFLTACHI